MASIRPRKDKDGKIVSYQIRVHKGYDVNGKQLRAHTLTWKPTPGMTPRQIEKELNRKTLLFEEECINGVPTSNIKLADFCSRYIEIMESSISPTTLQFYKNQINKFIIPALGHMKLKEIKTAHIQSYIQMLSKLPRETRKGEITDETLSPATIRRYLTVLQSILKCAVKLDLIHETPAKTEKLTLQKITAPKIEVFNKYEAAEMLECLENEELQFQVMVQLAIHMGARRGEIVALKFSDVDYVNRKITVQRAAIKIKDMPIQIKPPKDYEVRGVTVSKSCLELVKMLKAEKEREAARLLNLWNEGDWLFTQYDGTIMNPMTPTKQFAKFLKRNGLKHRKFHCLRHSSATLLLYGGANIKHVQSRLGHADIDTTSKYLHYIEEADAEAANILDNILNVQPKIEKVRRQQEAMNDSSKAELA
jgi:integrase